MRPVMSHLLIAASALIVGCVLATPRVARAQDVVVHPTVENLQLSRPTVAARRSRLTSGDTRLDAFAARLRAARRTDSISELDGDESRLFGRIAEVAVGTRGEIAVLDFANMNVRVFGSDGAMITQFGRQGSGPAEFRNAVALW